MSTSAPPSLLGPTYFKAGLLLFDGRALTWNEHEKHKTHFYLQREGKGRKKININLRSKDTHTQACSIGQAEVKTSFC